MVPADGTGVCGGCEGAAGPRRAKTSSPGRKTVPGLSRGGADEGEGEETSKSKNETRLVGARQPGREPDGLPRQLRLPGVASIAVQALRQLTVTTLSRDPTLMVKERGAMAQDCVGAIVERLKGWNQAAPTDPDKGAESSLAGSSLGRLVLELCLGKEGAETCKVLEKCLTMVSTESS